VKEGTVYQPTNKRTAIAEKSMPEISPNLPYPIRPAQGDRIGTLALPTIGKTLPIIHGTDEDELEKGVGHYANSVLPGEMDNSVLSGHRDTVFRQLGEIQKGDSLIVETTAGIFTYQFKEIRIVDQDDKTVIIPTDHAVLTVSTCYPFDFIGDAPKRYILISDLVKSEMK
jgi:sortase A